ncbi:MAG: ATP-binding cassette domain-containing protein, partial [Bacilli bacterium]
MIRLENVSKYYHNEGVVSLGLRKVSLEFQIGEFVAITGESGSGKSTLLNVISGIDTYEEGEIYINGEETSHYDEEDWEHYRKNRVAFIFQNYNLIYSYTVLKNVEVALLSQGHDLKTRRAKAKEILERVGLGRHLRHRASKLSGGEK